jgi:hypothetical protein
MAIVITDEQIAASATWLAGLAIAAVVLKLGILGMLLGALGWLLGRMVFIVQFAVRWLEYKFQVGALPVAVCKTGFVNVGERTYFRDPVDLRMYSVVPHTARCVDGVMVLNDYKLSPLDGDGKVAESALYGSDPISRRTTCPNDYISVYVGQGGEYHYLGGGYREGNFLITAAHVLTDSESHTLALSRDGEKFFCPSGVKRHFAKESYARCTGDDVGAFELSPADWAVLGVRSVKPTVYHAVGMSRIEVFGRSRDGQLQAGIGALLPPTQQQKKLGMVPHSASTKRGFSGSPVYSIGDGGRRIVGLHVAGGNLADNKNYMASVHEIHHLRRKLGLVPMPELKAESDTNKHYQYDRHQDRDDSDEEEIMDNLDRADRFGGTFGFYDSVKESAPLPPVLETKVPPAASDIPLPSFGIKGAPDAVDVLVEDAAEEEEYVTLVDVEAVAPPPVGAEHVRRRKVGNIGKFLGMTAFTGAAIVAGGKAFDSAWMVADGKSLREAAGADYQAMLDSPNFTRYREYLNAAHAEAAQEVRTMKGANEQDVARLFATGISNRSRKKLLKRLPEKFISAVEKLGLDIKKYTAWASPPSGVEAMEASLQFQLGVEGAPCWPQETRDQFAQKDGPLYQVFLDEVAKYPANRARVFDDMHGRISRFVLGLDGDKSAGWSQYFRPGTKRSWQDKEGLELASYFTRCRLLLRAAVGPDVMAQMTPSQLVEAGLSDPRTLFIKVEPHGESKISEGRWRLIWGASLVDVCTASVTCRRQDKLDIEQYQGGPVKDGHQQAAGLGHHDLGVDRLCREFDRLLDTGLEVFDADAKHWDMLVNRDSIYADAWRRVILYAGAYSDVFERLALCEAAANSAHVVLVGGNLWEVLKPGITASGILSTTAQNSFIRALLYSFVGVKSCVVAGDDAAGARVPGYDHTLPLKAYGPIEKAVNVYKPETGIEFTSHRFVKRADGWHATFLNLGKACARLALGDKEVQKDQLAGLLFCVRNEPAHVNELKLLSEEMGWPIIGVDPVFLPFVA